MDLDLQLLWHLLNGDISRIREFSLPPTMLNTITNKCVEFLKEYVNENSKIPSKATIFQEFGLKLSETDCDYEYILQKIQDKAFHQNAHKTIAHFAKLLSEKKYEDIEQDADSFGEMIKKMSLNYKDIDDLFSRKENKEVLEQYLNRKMGQYGIITPWKSLNECTWGWQKGDFAVAAARSGIGKCVSASTEMYDSDTGDIVTIKELVEKQLSTLSWDKEKGIVRYRPDYFWHTGKKQTNRIILRNGLSVEVTPEHPFLSPDQSEVKVEDGSLKVGSYIACAARIPFPKNTIEVSDEQIVITALLCADGGCTINTPTYSKSCNILKGLLEKNLLKIGYKLIAIKSDSCSYRIVNSIDKKSFLKKYGNAWGVKKCKSKEKEIPDFVFRLSEHQLIRWISLFFSSDGDVPNGNGASITLSSKKIIYQLRHLFLRLGIYSKIKYKKASCNKKHFDSWRLSIVGKYKEIFVETIPMVGSKFINWRREDCYQKQFYEYIPISKRIKDRIHQIIQEGKKSGLWMYQIGHKLGKKDVYRKRRRSREGHFSQGLCRADGFSESSMYSDTKKGMIKKKIFKIFCEHYNCINELGWLYNDVEWEMVEGIEDSGPQDVYDVTINKGHWFIGNDIVMHNTFFLLHMAIHSALTESKKVLFISPEMSRASIVNRCASIKLKINYKRIREGQLDSMQEREYSEFVWDKHNKFSEKFYIFSDEFEMNVENLKSAIAKIKPDVVFIDGIYLLRTKKESNRFDRAAIIADEIKQAAKKNEVPIITTTQLNRKAIGLKVNELTQDHLALSDALSWNADYIFVLGRDDKERELRQMILRPLKTRETDFARNIILNWDFQSHNFSEYDPSNDLNNSDIPF